MTKLTWPLASSILITALGVIPDSIISGTAPYALANSLIAKPGAWEITTTTLQTGRMIPPDALAGMPPDKRAKFEAAMQAREGKPATHVGTSCMTQKDLDEDRMIKSDGENQCTQKVISKSSNKLVIEKTCAPPRPSTSRMIIETKTPESLVANIDMVQGDAGGKVHVDIKGRWLKASCDGIKDRD